MLERLLPNGSRVESRLPPRRTPVPEVAQAAACLGRRDRHPLRAGPLRGVAGDRPIERMPGRRGLGVRAVVMGAGTGLRGRAGGPVEHPRPRLSILGPGCIRRQQATRGARRWWLPGCFIAGGATLRRCCPRSGQDVSSDARWRPRDVSSTLTGRQPRRLCAAAANARSGCCASGNRTPCRHVAHQEPVCWSRPLGVNPAAATPPGPGPPTRPTAPAPREAPGHHPRPPVCSSAGTPRATSRRSGRRRGRTGGGSSS